VGKVKLSCTPHEDAWASWGTAPCILNLGTRCRQMVSFTPLYLRERIAVLIA
jgi:hypothetical protein